MVIVIPKKAPGVRPPWWTTQSTGRPAINDGRHYITIPATLAVAADGTVSEPVACEHAGCGWQKTVRLEGYGA